MLRLAVLLAMVGAPGRADTLVATHTIRAQTLLTEEDITSVTESTPGALSSADDVVGAETRAILYAGRPIRPGDIGPPAIVKRNQIVVLSYRRGPLTILAEGRSLGRAGAGEVVRVMNSASHNTVSGVVDDDGSVVVRSGN